MAVLTVIADDLTGALDTGAKFCGEGRVVSVQWSGASPACDVLVIDTDSRAMATGEAAARVAGWAPRVQGRAYKKVDSTLRGPFAAESWALARALGCRGVLLAPASPAVGRTVRGGRLYVHGQAVVGAAPGIGSGPSAVAGDIAALVACQVEADVHHISRHVLAGGPAEVAAALVGRGGFAIADAESDRDLSVLARALLSLPEWLPAGSAGLAQAIAMEWGWRAELARLAPDEWPRLAACGSFNAVSRAQVATVTDALGLVPVVGSTASEIGAGLLRQLRERGVAVGTLPLESLGRDEAAAALEALAQATVAVATEVSARSLFVTGGETLRRVCEHLHVSVLGPRGELEPGIVASTATLRDGRALTIVSRAGGFGSDDLLVRLLTGTG